MSIHLSIYLGIIIPAYNDPFLCPSIMETCINAHANEADGPSQSTPVNLRLLSADVLVEGSESISLGACFMEPQAAVHCAHIQARTCKLTCGQKMLVRGYRLSYA